MSVVKGFILPLRSLSELSRGGTSVAPIFFQQTPSISDSKGASFDAESPMGSSEPYQNYSSSSARTISLGLTYLAVSHRNDFRWAAQQIQRIKALVYPIFARKTVTQTDFSPPPMILLNYGHRFINLPCKVTGYSTSSSEDDTIENESQLPLETKISLELTVSYPFGYAPGHDDVALMYTDNDFYGAGGQSVIPELKTSVGELSDDQYLRREAIPVSSPEDRANSINLSNTKLYVPDGNIVRVSTRKIRDFAFTADQAQPSRE